MHQGYKIQQGHKSVVLKIMQHNLKVLKNATKQGYINKVLKDKLKFKLKYFQALKESNLNIQEL